jgi:oligopeptide transport system substrate-binding protein
MSARRLLQFILLFSSIAAITAGCTIPFLGGPGDEGIQLFTSNDPGDYPVRFYMDDENLSLEPPVGWSIERPTEEDILLVMTDPEGDISFTLVWESYVQQDMEDANAAFINQRWFTENEVIIAEVDDLDLGAENPALRSNGLVPQMMASETTQRWAAISWPISNRLYHLIMIVPEDAYSDNIRRLQNTAASLQLESLQAVEYPRQTALVLNSGEPNTLDPALTHSGASGLMADLFSGLVRMDPHLEIQPDLAQRWEVSPDGLVYTFYLQPEARFHNGRPVTADDVVFSWERAASSQTNSSTALLYLGDIAGLSEFHAGQAEAIEGLEVLDDLTLQVTLDAPKAYFLAKLTYPTSWIVDRYNVHMPDWEQHPNGTGPFRHSQHLIDDLFLLERNPYYYGSEPQLEHIAYLMYAGYTQRLYESGSVDMTYLNQDQLSRANDPNDDLFGTVISEQWLCTTYVTFNTDQPPFDDPLVRQALAHAVDKERLVEAITNGEGIPSWGLLPPGLPGYNQRVAPLIYDPEQARALLASSAYYDGSQQPPEIIWTIPTTSGYVPPIIAFLADTWQSELGLEITLEGVDSDVYFQRIDAGEYGQLLLEGWCADYPDPENFMDVLFHSESPQNHARYTNQEFDQLIESARIEPDLAQRLAIYRQAEQMLLDQAPAIFLYHPGPSYLVWKPYIKGYQPAAISVPQHLNLSIEQ